MTQTQQDAYGKLYNKMKKIIALLSLLFGCGKPIFAQQWGILPAAVNGVYPSTQIKQSLADTFGLIRNTYILTKPTQPSTQRQVLTVLWAQPFVNGTPHPVPFCTDTATYRTKVRALITATKANTILYQVENEPCNNQFYSGNILQYLDLLNIFCDEAHKQGAMVTDGGITTTLASILTYEYYLSIGDNTTADMLAHIYYNDSDYLHLPQTRKSKQYQYALSEGLFYVAHLYNCDYVNLHWYEPVQLRNGGTWYNSVKMKGCEKAIAYLKKETGKPCIITETAQLVASEHDTNKMARRYKKLSVPYVIWFNGGDCAPYFDESGNATELGDNLLKQIK